MSVQEQDQNSENVPVEEMNFEEAFASLEVVVNSLESGKYSLAQAVELFERGQELARRCAALLDEAELKVEQLTNAGLKPFEPQE
jgi:exodeoxyribonuclease VII small subunit